jgi:predicted ester cyclase
MVTQSKTDAGVSTYFYGKSNFFVAIVDIEFGIEILVYMYVLYVSAYGVFSEICRKKL